MPQLVGNWAHPGARLVGGGSNSGWGPSRPLLFSNSARRGSAVERTLSSCSDRHGTPTREDGGEDPRPLQSLIKTTLLAATVLAANPALPSGAAEFRRHHRRLQMESSMDMQLMKDDRRKKRRREAERAKKARAEKEEMGRALREAKLKDDILLQSVESIKQALNANGDSKAAAKISISTRARPAPSSVYGSIRQRDSPMAAGMGIVWGLVGVAVFMFMKSRFGWSFGWLTGSRRSGAAGRWVRDRSLGGRMVFIEDTSKPATPRPLWDDLPGGDEARKQKTVPGYLSGSDEDAEVAALGIKAPEKVAPVWFAPPQPVKYVGKDRKMELQKQADGLVKKLQNEKVELGQDYSLRGLVDLRQTCHSGGGLTVTTSTQSGRDSMLRMAVKHSLGNPKSSLAGYEPSRFVSGLATDLGVPQERAITIVHAEIASMCRNALIDAEAAFRAEDEGLLSRSLSKILHALQSFPLPSGSAEMEMVGRSVMRTTSLEFRKAVFFSAGSVDLSIAPVVAEMLGFQPELVMPQLITQMQLMSNPSEGGTQSDGDEGGN